VVALVWTWWRIWNSARLDRLVRGHQLYRVVAVGAPTLLLVAYFGGTLTINSPYAIAHISDSGGDQPQVPLAVLMPNVDLGEPGQPVLVWNLHPRGWHIEHPFDDWQASQALRSIGHPIAPDHALLRHDSAETCDWLRQNPTAIRLTGPLRGQDQLLASGCPADVVRPEEWQVITTPAAWWVDNRYTNTGKDAFREA
jgi:hypothetical protein